MFVKWICSVETEVIHDIWLEFVNLLEKGDKCGREWMNEWMNETFIVFSTVTIINDNRFEW